MDAFERRIREQMKEMPQLHMREEVRSRVRQRVPRGHTTVLRALRYGAATLAALCVFAGFWQLSPRVEQALHLQPHREPIHVTAPIAYNQHVVALSYAPISISNVHFAPVYSNPNAQPSADNKVIGHTIVATIRNNGTSVLGVDSVQGMLFITKTPSASITANDTWQDFVNLIPTQLKPGQSVEWSYQPVPDNWYRSDLQPSDVHLFFVFRDQTAYSAGSQRAPLVWRTPNVTVHQTHATKNAQGGITVKATVSNDGLTMVDLGQLFAMIDFTAGENEALLPPDGVAFFASPHEQGVIAPGHTQTVTFTVIPIPGHDLSQDTPKITFVER